MHYTEQLGTERQAHKQTDQTLSQFMYSFHRSLQGLKEPVSQNLRVRTCIPLLDFRFSQLQGCRPLQVKYLRQAFLVPLHNVVIEL